MDGEKKEAEEKGLVPSSSSKPYMCYSFWPADDFGSIILLLVLYTIQGIPMGLSGSIPFLMQGKVSYVEQGIFSLVSLPFSLKLLWAPLVDSVYSSSFGRRKSWLVPIQLFCGLLMLWGSSHDLIDNWLNNASVRVLTCYFFILYFLMATQDIAVDGWALTMLSPRNKGYASTCNTIGQTVGFFISHIGFLALNDPGTCNRLFRSDPLDLGMVTLSSFLRFWAWVIIACTVFVWLFKQEVASPIEEKSGGNTRKSSVTPHVESCVPLGPISPEELHLFAEDYLAKKKDLDVHQGSREPEGVLEAYGLLFHLVKLRPVQLMMIVCLTCRIPFAVTDSSTHFKLVEAGVSKEELAFLAPLLVPFGILCPVLVGKYAAGRRPLGLFSLGIPLRMVMTIVWAAMLPLTRYVYSMSAEAASTGPPLWYYLVIYIVTSLQNITSDLMFVSLMAFYAKVSDPSIGGTYMTFLNTITNLGVKWTSATSLFLLDYSNLKRCEAVDGKQLCEILVDGYYVQLCACFLLGLVWILAFSSKTRQLEETPSAAWLLAAGTTVGPQENGKQQCRKVSRLPPGMAISRPIAPAAGEAPSAKRNF